MENNRKKIAIIAAIVLALALGAAAAFTDVFKGDGTISREKVNISEDERKAAEEQINQAEEQIKNLPKDASPEVKYGPYMQLADNQAKLGNYKEAIEAIEAVEADNKDNTRVLSKKAQIYTSMKDYAKAGETWKQVVKLDPENPTYWKDYLTLQNDHLNTPYQEVDRQYNEAFFRTGMHIDVVLSYIKFLEKHQNYQGAVNFANLGLQKDPNNETLKSELERLKKLSEEQAKQYEQENLKK